MFIYHEHVEAFARAVLIASASSGEDNNITFDCPLDLTNINLMAKGIDLQPATQAQNQVV